MTSQRGVSDLSPAEIASRYGIKVDAVPGWIKSRELRAIDVARSRTRKLPRWRVSPADLESFEEARAAKPHLHPPPKPRRKTASDVIQFF